MLLFLNNPVHFDSLNASDSGERLPTFQMLAYTGVPMRFPQFVTPVVIDLSTLSLAAAQTPILREHDGNRIVGHGTVSISPQRVRVNGVVSGVGQDARDVVTMSRNKFPWQASVRCDLSAMPEYIESGRKVTVNGRSWTGPLLVARNAILQEVSFTPIGRDGASTVSLSASASEIEKVIQMGFSEWLKAKGFDEATLTEAQKLSLKASYDQETELADLRASAQQQQQEGTDDEQQDNNQSNNQVVNMVTEATRQLRASAAAEARLQASIRQLCGTNTELFASALEQNWSLDRVRAEVATRELETLRASRGNAPNVPHGSDQNLMLILEASVCQYRRIAGHEKQYSDQILQAAHTRFRGNIDLHQILLLAAQANGYQVGTGQRVHAGNMREVLQYALPSAEFRMLRAAASGGDLSTMLSNIANKELLAGFMEEDQTWREVSQVRTVNDFKTVTAFRMLDDMEYEELGPNGEITHGSLSSQSYTRKAKTYAKMAMLDRTDIINNDLDKFNDVRARVGRGAAIKLNRVHWQKWLNLSNLFKTGNNNYISGATTNLGVDGVGLQAAITAFGKLRSPDEDGKKVLGGRFGGRPDRLLHPIELQFNADRLYQSTTVNTGGAATAESVGNANIHANKYRPIPCVFLSDPSLTNYSEKAWYLLRDPVIASALIVSFLNGNQQPVVETADADFDQLGIQFRGYHDFGVDEYEPLCGIKSKGEV